MKIPYLIAIAFIFAFTMNTKTHAHDIGVSPAELIELPNNQYRLSVQSFQTTSYLFPPPMLPDHCQLTSNPSGLISSAWKTYEFSCDTPLTADHSLTLPWQRDGIMLSATWSDNTHSKSLFQYKNGNITVNLTRLQVGSGSFLGAAKRYTTLGFEHILQGLDHLLFVFGLLLIVSSPWLLVKTITAFTNEIPVALLFFNIGVELGQLAFVLALILLNHAAKQIKFSWPNWTKPIPAYSIGTIACYWLMIRVGDMLIMA